MSWIGNIPEGFVPKTWRGEGNVWTNPVPDGSVQVAWSLGREDGRRGELQVWFDPDRRVSALRLHLPDGLTPSTLQRFPWRRWLSVADSAGQLFSREMSDSEAEDEVRHLERSVDAVRAGTRAPRRSRGGRPGRGGYPDSHYRHVADRYLTLFAQGRKNPTAIIAMEEHASRPAAASWVATARKKGFLPKARRGRAG